MSYLNTYKGHRLFSNLKGVYCYDKLNRKSKTYESISKIKHEIDDDTVTYITGKLSPLPAIE